MLAQSNEVARPKAFRRRLTLQTAFCRIRLFERHLDWKLRLSAKFNQRCCQGHIRRMQTAFTQLIHQRIRFPRRWCHLDCYVSRFPHTQI